MSEIDKIVRDLKEIIEHKNMTLKAQDLTIESLKKSEARKRKNIEGLRNVIESFERKIIELEKQNKETNRRLQMSLKILKSNGIINE